MSRDGVSSVKDAVHKLQLSLLEGIKHERQLLAAGSLISRNDYNDVVIERTIADMCGYPLCSNSLPSERPRKGRYRISLKEHKVYDLQETYLYCSSECLINSRAFAANLPDERSSTLNPSKLNQLLRQFEGLSLKSTVDMGENGDLGLADLKIEEKTEREAGEVSFEEWIGPTNAVDGYVPRRDKNLAPQQLNNNKNSGKREKTRSKHSVADPNALGILSHDMNFTSTIMFQDEYSVSKTVTPGKAKQPKGNKDKNSGSKPIRNPAAASMTNIPESKSKESDIFKNATETDGKVNLSDDIASSSQTDTSAVKKLYKGKDSAVGAGLKSSLKTSDSKRTVRSVTWADEKTDFDEPNLGEFEEAKDENGTMVTPHLGVEQVSEESDRLASAEACAIALSQAAEAVASGKSDESDAVSEAGVIILPSPHGVDAAKPEENADVMDIDPIQLKWPPKPGFSSSDLLDCDDSWYDGPPEGFSLTLSPFSTMYMALFAWISSSSLAYIYGKEDSFHEEYLWVNGREYPQKIVLSDGRSSEIKQTLSGYLARALPGLVTELRLPIPISILEKGMRRLLDTLSFVDPIPAFRMKQWHVIVLLFLDALSVTRIPSLTQFIRRPLLPKVLEGAQLSSEEFEIMKELIIPLGRTPKFSTQSGG